MQGMLLRQESDIGDRLDFPYYHGQILAKKCLVKSGKSKFILGFVSIY
jgi:hypothetical protein